MTRGRKTREPLIALNGAKQLSNTELKYMEIIWQHPEGISSEELYQMFHQAFGTKTTIVSRIINKGHAISKQEGKHYIYFPVTTKEDYEKALIKQTVMQKMGGTSFESLVAAFCGKSELSDREEEELLHFLDMIEKGESDND